jgi:hypothetical protein
MVDRRKYGVEGATSGGADGPEANPPYLGGQLPAIGSHDVSAAKAAWYAQTEKRGIIRVTVCTSQESGGCEQPLEGSHAGI